jgi:hypothetical protein
MSDTAVAEPEVEAEPQEEVPAKEKKQFGRKVKIASKATFGVDDKRAQYARLAIFNFGVKEKIITGKTHDVNSVPNAQLEKAGKVLIGGTLLDGEEGLKMISQLTMAGATDEKVAKRGLTRAYSAECRPFIRRLQLSDNFGRRTVELTPEQKEARKAALAAGRAKAAAKKKPAGKRNTAQARASAKS